MVEVIKDHQPTDEDRAFLTRYLGQPAGTQLVDLCQIFEKRTTYVQVMEGAVNTGRSLAVHRAHIAQVQQAVNQRFSEDFLS